MKIYKSITSSVEYIEEETQKVINELLNDYPNGKIESFQSSSTTRSSANSYIYISNSIIFETEPEQTKSEVTIDNPLILNQFIESLKDLINH